MITETMRLMVEVDPEAFGLDGAYEPRLGCASTAQLLMELDARLGADEPSPGDYTALLPDKRAVARRAVISLLRNGLTVDQLAYRTID